MSGCSNKAWQMHIPVTPDAPTTTTRVFCAILAVRVNELSGNRIVRLKSANGNSWEGNERSGLATWLRFHIYHATLPWRTSCCHSLWGPDIGRRWQCHEFRGEEYMANDLWDCMKHTATDMELVFGQRIKDSSVRKLSSLGIVWLKFMRTKNGRKPERFVTFKISSLWLHQQVDVISNKIRIGLFLLWNKSIKLPVGHDTAYCIVADLIKFSQIPAASFNIYRAEQWTQAQ